MGLSGAMWADLYGHREDGMKVSDGLIRDGQLWEEHYYDIAHDGIDYKVVIRCEKTYRWDWLLDIDGLRFGYCNGVNDGLKRAKTAIRNGSVARIKTAREA